MDSVYIRMQRARTTRSWWVLTTRFATMIRCSCQRQASSILLNRITSGFHHRCCYFTTESHYIRWFVLHQPAEDSHLCSQHAAFSYSSDDFLGSGFDGTEGVCRIVFCQLDCEWIASTHF